MHVTRFERTSPLIYLIKWFRLKTITIEETAVKSTSLMPTYAILIESFALFFEYL